MNRLRTWVKTVQAEEAPEGMWVHIVHCRDKSFHALSPAAKTELVRTFLELTGAPQWLRVWAEARWEGASGDRKPKLTAKTILLTYNGDFGLLPVDQYLPLVCVERTSGQLRMDPTVRQLWADQVTHTQWLCEQLAANFYACSLELCTKTYQKGSSESTATATSRRAKRTSVRRSMTSSGSGTASHT